MDVLLSANVLVDNRIKNNIHKMGDKMKGLFSVLFDIFSTAFLTLAFIFGLITLVVSLPMLADGPMGLAVGAPAVFGAAIICILCIGFLRGRK